MESHLQENFDVRPEHLSAEALERWRNLSKFVKNRKRRFRFTANLPGRYEAMLEINQDLRSQSELQGLRSESKSQGLRSESELQGLRWSESESQGWWFESKSQGWRSESKSQGWWHVSVFFLVMEAISVVLDVYGKSKENFLLAAFVLSAFGFIITIYAFIRKTRTAAYRQKPVQELAWVEVAFSVLQLVTLFIQYILAAARVKNSYSPSLYPLVFALLVVVFAFKKKQISHSQERVLDP